MQRDTNGIGRTAVLLDPHPMCCGAMASLLKELGTTIVGSASSVDAALALLKEHSPDLLVAELALPEGSEQALSLIATGRRLDPDLTAIVVSGSDDTELRNAAFDAGASAYILKTAELEAVKTAISEAFEPKIYLARWRELPAGDPASDDCLFPRLTRRELEILQLVSEGGSNRQVGQVLWITDQTVKFHLANIYRKLGVGSRYDAVRWARENGVLPVAASSEVITIGSGANGANGSETDLLAEPVALRGASVPAMATGAVQQGTSR